MFVRTATIQDLDTLVDFGKRLTQESAKFSIQGFDEDRAIQLFSHLINKHESIFLVCDEHSNPVGGLIVCIDVDWRTNQRLAFEQGVYVLPEYRATGSGSELVRHFIEWAKLNNADRIQLGTISGIHADKTVSLYKSLGFEMVGYVLELEV